MKIFITLLFFTLMSYSSASIETYVLNCGNDTILAEFDATAIISDGKTNATILENLKNITGGCTNMTKKEFFIEFQNGAQLKFIIENRDGKVYLYELLLKTESLEANKNIDLPLSSTAQYYECKEEQKFILTGTTDTDTTVSIIFRTFKLQAFNVKNLSYSTDYSVCENKNGTTITPVYTTTYSTSTPSPKTTLSSTTLSSTSATSTSAKPTTKPSTETTTVTTHKPTSHSTSPTHTTVTTKTPTPTTLSPDGLADMEVKKNGSLCLSVEFKGTATINYMKDGKMAKYEHIIDHGDIQGKPEGSCGLNSQFVMANLSRGCSIEFHFSRTKTVDSRRRLLADENYSMTNASFTIDLAKSINSSGIVTFHSSKEIFTTTVGRKYMCKSLTLIKNTNMTLKVTQFSAGAFGPSGKDVDTCPADKSGSNNIVPIVVGVILACLVVTIIIAYLIGRRRDRSGYQSV